MSLKEYRHMPDEGLFEKIRRRLLLRRIGTVAIVAVVTAVVAGVTIWVAHPRPTVVADNSTKVAIELPQVSTEPMLQPIPKASAQVVEKKSVKSEDANMLPDENTVLQSPALPAPQPVTPPTGQSPSHTAAQGETTPPPTPSSTQTSAYAVAQTDSTLKTPVPVAETKGEQQPEQQSHFDNILWAPNVMVPASDNERNRQFKVVSTSPVSDYRIVIYNRGGRQVYSSADINAVWDATINGEHLPQGTYVWVARFKDSSGAVRQEKGTVTVIR